jgi:hypothetical protein
MPSEIRVNTIKSRAGLGTFDISDSGLSIVGVMTATSFSGDGSGLTGIAAVGGASTNRVFYENDQVVGVNYTISTSKNAMSAGPITVGAGITVTIPSGSSWTIV